MMDGTTTDNNATPAPAPAAVSHCSHGGKWVLMDDDDGMTTGSDGETTRHAKHKNGPRDIIDVSWARGIYFLFSTSFLFANKVFYLLMMVTTTTMNDNSG
jgi:hypothetical protein